MKLFYNSNNQTKKLENLIEEKIDIFINKINKDKDLKKYIRSFGIIGPTARGEGFYYNSNIRSDIDFFVLTNFISLKFAKKLKNIFNETFEKNLDASLLFFSPNSLKKPDLMVFELTNTGIFLYGEKLSKLPLDKVSKFESVRNLVYRGMYFLDKFYIENGELKIKDNITKQNFLYAFSKVVFSLGEVFLLLDNNYSASNFKRNELLKSNKYAIKLKSFVELHEKMHNFRYNNDIPEKINYNNYKKNGFNLIVYGYKTIFKELFGCGKVKCTQFSKIKAIGISFFANRILYTLNLFFHFKRVNIYFLKEPFIDFVERYIMFSDNIVNKKKVYQKDLDILIQDWKTASWLYYYK